MFQIFGNLDVSVPHVAIRSSLWMKSKLNYVVAAFARLKWFKTLKKQISSSSHTWRWCQADHELMNCTLYSSGYCSTIVGRCSFYMSCNDKNSGTSPRTGPYLLCVCLCSTIGTPLLEYISPSSKALLHEILHFVTTFLTKFWEIFM